MFVAVAVERVVALYKNLLEVRKLRQQMEDQGVPVDNLAGVDEYANSVMAEGIDTIVDEIVADAHYSLDAGRQNELKVEVRLSLNGIANRIDAGFNIDVRAGAGPEQEEAEANGSTDDAEAVRMIQNASPNLRFINRPGRPILSLQEGPGQDDHTIGHPRALVIELDEEPPPPRSPPTSCDIHRATPGADPGRRASTPRTTSSDLFASPSSRASSECISAPRTGKRDTVGTKLVSKSSPKSPPNDLRSSGQAERNPL